jgi:hypothetical protein
MLRPSSPQSRFLFRALLCFAGFLLTWWFVLRPPLLAWTRFATDFALNAVPGVPLKTGVTISPDGIWVVQAPIRRAGRWRNVRVESDNRLPTQLTVGLPLLWAILAAGPRRRRGEWRTWAAGSAILLAVPPAGLLVYAAHVVQIYLFPAAPGVVRGGIAAADYFTSTAAPYIIPVVLAVALQPELRRAVLEEVDSPVPDPKR